jgi:hypothetical protein
MLTALLPVFLLILLGYVFRRTGFPGEGFWLCAERSTYFVFFPALLVDKLAFARFQAGTALPMALSLMASILCLSAFLLLVSRLVALRGPAFSSVFQGSVRFNTFVGLAGASAILGPSGLTLAAVALVGMIPLINLICVPAVAAFGAGRRSGPGRLLLEIARNPLILACGLGFLINLTPVPTPEGLFRVFDLLGRAALPIGLLAVGAGLRIQGMAANGSGLVMASALKLLAFPLLAAAFCSILDVQGEARTVAVLFASLPTAVSSFILARQLGGDTELMASIITLQTVLSALTMPVLLELLA